MEQLAHAPIFIDDTPGISLTEMRAKARRLQQQRGGIDLVVVDYLQLMSGGSKRYENRTQEVSAISRGLKALAKELNVPVIALSQLSRAPESRGGDHRPQLADLRESGSIEQDADLVAFIFREEVYKQDDPDLAGQSRTNHLQAAQWPDREGEPRLPQELHPVCIDGRGRYGLRRGLNQG